MDSPSSLLQPLRSILSEVGAFQLAEWRTRPYALAQDKSWAREKAAKDLVTFVDLESERRLASALAALLPGSAFYGEEGEQSLGDFTWVVDPLDGTTNYVAGLDWFCISVALFERTGSGAQRPVLGLVHRSATKEWHWAVRGEGAWTEGPGSSPARRLEAARPRALRDSLVCTGTPYRSPDTAAAFYGAAAAVSAAALDIRRLGSAALDLCSVAEGRFQAFWEVDLKPYDLGAALLLLEESGCPYSAISGRPFDPFSSRGFVTGAPGAAEELRSLIAPFYAAALAD